MATAEGRQRWNSATLPRARLRPPAVQALERERLLDALARGGHRLVLITGPAGSGKTTLLAQLVQMHTHVWYHVDDGDGRAPVLLRHLAEALGTVVPGLKEGWEGREGDAHRGWESVEQAVAALEQVEGADVLLALDDIHVLAGTAAEEALGRVLDLAPPWLRVAATCRQPPRWNLSRLRVSGTLREVGADDLRFRSWEVERLFAELYREPLPPGDLAQLTRSLEGWAAGLQMFHLATRGKPVTARRRAVAALPARSKLIREYLTGNVLDELPDELRTFLVETSVFGRLSPALADQLRGRHDSAQLLDDLEARQVFVVRADEEGEDGTYRYHEVFRTYLEGRLVERDGHAEARAWSQRAAELLEASGHMLEALRAYCRAEDWRAVERVLAQAGPELVEDSVSWLDWLPQGLIEGDPWAMLAAARRAAATGRFARALDLYAQAAQVPAAATAAEIARRERAALAGWVDPVAPPPPGWGGRLLAALRSRPTELVAPAPGLDADGPHAGWALAAGVAALLAGDLRAATRWLAAPVDDPEADVTVVAAARLALAVTQALGGPSQSSGSWGMPDPPGRPRVLGAGGGGVGSHGFAGSAPAGLDELPEVLDAADVPWLGWLARALRGLDGTGGGMRQATEAADTLDRQGDVWGGTVSRLFGALGAVLAGGSPIAELDDLATRLRGLDVPVLECWCLAWQATALARQAARPGHGGDVSYRNGHAGAAAAPVPTPAPDGQTGSQQSALVPLHPSDGSVVTAEIAAAEAEATAARIGVPGAQVWAATVQAQLAEATGDADAAATYLAQAAALRQRWNVDVVVPPLRPLQAATEDQPARSTPSTAAGHESAAPARDGAATSAQQFGHAAPATSAPRSGHPAALATSATAAVTQPATPSSATAADRRTPAVVTPTPTPLRLRVLGGFSLEVDGRLVELRTAKPRVRAALRLLAAQAGRPVHVETLIEALWPDGDPSAGKRSLQVALSSLRRLLDDHSPGTGALVQRDGEAYLLALPKGAEVDAVEFGRARDACRAAARQGDAEVAVAMGERALDLYGGELLPEDGPAEWAVVTRRNLAQDAAEVASLVADHAIALRRWDAAVAACSRGLDVDRYSDGLWRLLAVAHEGRGDRAAAAQVQERYRLVLEDLGMTAS